MRRRSVRGRIVVVPRLYRLTTDDWPLWRDLRFAALADAPHAFESRLADWSHDEKRWRTRFERPDTCDVVALDDGKPVGMASGVPVDSSVSELRSVWVSPTVRGRGVGDRLLQAIEDWARASGATIMKLAVVPSNEAAIALYRRHGYVANGERGAVLSDGVTTEQVMAKALR